jgi:hypothetical protein
MRPQTRLWGQTRRNDVPGFRSPVIVLGLSATPPPVGFRSPLPFWNIGTTQYIPPEPEAPRKGGGYSLPDYRTRLLREDEEILAVIMAYMETRH